MRVNALVRVRRLVARRPWVVWVTAVGLVLVVATSVNGALGALDEQRAAWGEATEVWVASDVLAAGDEVAGRIEQRTVPAAVVPDDALVVDGRPDAATRVRQRVGVGEIVTAHDVTAPDGHRTLVPPGWVSVAIREPIATGATVGQPVVVSADGAVLAGEATVVGVHTDAVLVAVPAIDGPAVAAAATESRATLLLGE